MPSSMSNPESHWKNDFGEVIQERKKKLNRWKILMIFDLCLAILSLIGTILSAQLHNTDLMWISTIIFYTFPFILIFGMFYMKRVRFIYGVDTLFYNLYELSCLFEKYQKPDETLQTKKELFKEIKKLLKESNKVIHSYEYEANKYVYPDDLKESLLFFKKNYHYFNYALKNKKFPTGNALKSVRDGCDNHMKLRIRNSADFKKSYEDVFYAWKLMSMPEYVEVREKKWLKFFINRTTAEKIILYSIFNTIIVGASFYFIVPLFATENLFTNGVAVWGVFEAGIFVALYANKSLTGT